MELGLLVQIGVLAFFALLAIASAYGVLFPRQLCQQVRAAWHVRFAMMMAVMVRLLFGTMLIYFAPHTKFPLLFRIFGVLGLVAAVGLPTIGWQRIDRLLQWIESRPMWIVRTVTVVAVLLAGLLFYGALGV